MSKRDALRYIKERNGPAPDWHKDAKKILKKIFPDRRVFRSSGFPDELVVDFETTVTQSDTDKIKDLFEYTYEHDFISITKDKK